MKENKVITDIEQLTPEWLTNIFKKKGYLSNGKVTKIIMEKSQKNVSSDVFFFKLVFSIDARVELPSAEIVVKKWNFINGNEVHFYNSIANQMKENAIPSCYYAYTSKGNNESIIILNNMLTTHKEYSTALDKLTKRHAKRAIETLAEIHAFWWEHPKLEKIIIGGGGLNITDKNKFMLIYNTIKNTLHQWLDRADDKISHERKELYKKCYSLYPEVFWKRIRKRKNLTLIHGDAHLAQFFYPKDIENKEHKAYLADWICCQANIGTYDLAYMIGIFNFFSDPEVYYNTEKECIEHYHTALLNCGVKNYSYDDCFYDFKMGLINNFYMPFWLQNPEILFQENYVACDKHYFNHSVLNFKEFNCIELLENKE